MAQTKTAQHDFCTFAEQLQANSEIMPIFTNFQKRLQLNSNLILFCIWFAATGQKRLTKHDTQHLITTVLNWHEKITEALENLQHKAPDNIQANIAKTIETANQQEQLMLAQAITKECFSRTSQQKSADAYKNIETYCQVMSIIANQKDMELVTDLLAQVFPA